MSEEIFGAGDYVLIAIFLGVSIGIGIYYGVIRKQQTTDHYLYGNHKMPLLPVALSLLVTYQSATSCLGIPAEVYSYSTMVFYQLLGIVLAIAIAAFAIVPLLYPLQLNTAYEYLGRRFNSRSVQLLATVIGMLQTLLYMSIVLFSPALALEAVTGIPLWASVIVVGVIGTLYTSLGGLRSVVWTNVFQFALLYGGLVVILGLGSKKVDSLGEIFTLATEGHRLHFSASFDPRVRHTLWSCVLGGLFTWLPNTCNQTAVQRIVSLKNQRAAKIAVLISAPFTLLFGGLLIFLGLVLYAYFVSSQCGPIEAGYLHNSNQLLAYFVIRVLHEVPALAGLFVVVLFSGALSSLSAGIHALSANMLHDVLGARLEKVSQAKKTLLAKLTVLGFGALAIGIAYSFKYATGPVTQVATTAMGALGGPYFGMFCLGAIFPQANWIGALVGGVTGLVFNVWLVISASIHALPTQLAPPITTSGCTLHLNISQHAHHQSTVFPTLPSLRDSVTIFSTPQNDINSTAFFNFTQDINYAALVSSLFYFTTEISSHLTTDNSSGTPVMPSLSSSVPGVSSLDVSPEEGHIYDISYLYFGLTGFLVSLVTGMMVSLCSGKDRYSHTDPIYIFPWLRRFWNFRFTSSKTTYVISERRWSNSMKRSSSTKRLSTDDGGPDETTPIRALEFTVKESDTL